MKHPAEKTIPVWQGGTTARLGLWACIWIWALSLAGCGMERHYRRDARFDDIDAIVTDQIRAGNIPGAVVLVGQADRILYWEAFGDAMVEPNRVPMDRRTIFDLASLTKPIATATSILILVDQGRLDLDDPVGKYLPAFACNGKEDARIHHLLTHTSGLPAYTSAAELERKYGSPCPRRVIERICGLQALSPPGEKFRYSCLGYIVLAEIVHVVSGEDIGRFSRQHIFEPLGMRDTTFNPPPSWTDRIAATTIVDGRPLRGTVHDPLARLRGGLSGNAGLFSSAPDLAVFCRMLLNGGTLKGRRILSPQAVAMLTQPQSHGRAFGFDVGSGYAWIKGPNTSERAFCHSGYTGTSIVIDPAREAYLVLLTNRVHPKDAGSCKTLRKRIAERVFGVLGSPAPGPG